MIQCVIWAKRTNSFVTDSFGAHDFRAFIGSLISPNRIKHEEFGLKSISRIGTPLKNPASYRNYGKVSGIYAITDGTRMYVGQSVDIARRFDEHVRMIVSKSHHSPSMNDLDVLKLTFKVLARSKDNLDELETKFYRHFKDKFVMLNATEL